jgi:Leucine-rich repeat (LRR) protein
MKKRINKISFLSKTKLKEAKLAILIISFTFLGFVTKAQNVLLDSLYLDTMVAFTSIQEAMKNPESVIKLELRRKGLKTFPKEILQMKNLQYLDLSKNKLLELPPEIGELTNLQVLILSKNKITSLPTQIGMLQNLEILNINQNDLVALPPQLGNLRNLRNLDLWSNEIGVFPEELKYLKNLNVMDLRVVLIPDAEQERLRRLLPSSTIFFSPYCKCQQ